MYTSIDYVMIVELVDDKCMGQDKWNGTKHSLTTNIHIHNKNYGNTWFSSKLIICMTILKLFVYQIRLFWHPGWVLPYLAMVGRSSGADPCFFIFNLIGSLFYTPTQSDWPPLSAEKNGLSLSNLGPEILRPKVGLLFTKMYCLTDVKHFVSIFSMLSNPTDPLYHWF